MRIFERHTRPFNGYAMLPITLVSGIASMAAMGISLELQLPVVTPILVVTSALVFLVSLISLGGFFIVNPNESRVLTLFGKYVGSVKKDGFYWVNPFYKKQTISLRAANFQGETLKVNDKIGNPIDIAAVIVWKVEDTAKAAFEVNNYREFVRIQSESAVRSLAGAYPYDNFDDAQAEITLRDGGEVVNKMLEAALSERLEMAGIEIIEARISHLAYAPEIAHSMLQRQQATAIVAARFKIVEGAVSMVEMAIDELEKQKGIDLDAAQKASMVSNLMVVLCGDRSASPVINAGAA